MAQRKRKTVEEIENEKVMGAVDRGQALRVAEVERAVLALERAKVFVSEVGAKKPTYTFTYRGARITGTTPQAEWIAQYEQRR